MISFYQSVSDGYVKLSDLAPVNLRIRIDGTTGHRNGTYGSPQKLKYERGLVCLYQFLEKLMG
jgi:hypothetical protein